jgi:hypothetical protein
MSNKQLRMTFRVIHLLASISLIAMVYSPVLRHMDQFILLLQIVVIPVIGLSGLAMWQQANITKLRRSLSPRKSQAS